MKIWFWANVGIFVKRKHISSARIFCPPICGETQALKLLLESAVSPDNSKFRSDDRL